MFCINTRAHPSFRFHFTLTPGDHASPLHRRSSTASPCRQRSFHHRRPPTGKIAISPDQPVMDSNCEELLGAGFRIGMGCQLERFEAWSDALGTCPCQRHLWPFCHLCPFRRRRRPSPSTSTCTVAVIFNRRRRLPPSLQTDARSRTAATAIDCQISIQHCYRRRLPSNRTSICRRQPHPVTNACRSPATSSPALPVLTHVRISWMFGIW